MAFNLCKFAEKSMNFSFLFLHKVVMLIMQKKSFVIRNNFNAKLILLQTSVYNSYSNIHSIIYQLGWTLLVGLKIIQLKNRKLVDRNRISFPWDLFSW